MDEFLRTLTHDDRQFQTEWNNIDKRSRELPIGVDGKAVLNALADYVLEQPTHGLQYSIKFVFIKNMVERIVKENLSIPLSDIVAVFARVLDRYTSGCWHVNFLDSVYTEFQLGKCLCSEPIETNLIEEIFQSIEKKTFINEKKDEDYKWESLLHHKVFPYHPNDSSSTLNNKDIMKQMRKSYQELYRCAIKNVGRSSVWTAIEKSLKSGLGDLFDSYDPLTDAEQDLILYPDYPNHSYLTLFISSFEKNLALFQANYVKFLECVERLILMGKLIDASMLINQVINKHLASVDLSPLLDTFIRICSTMTNSTDSESRNSFCSTILYYLSYKLRDVKTQKGVAPLYFDLTIAILKLSVINAPQSAQSLITRSEFYSWKDLGPRIHELIKTCISYESLVHQSYFSNLDGLENIVKIIDDRAKQYPVILRSTHSIALEAILRWSDKDARYSSHVYKMCYSMLNLIDQTQINIQTCSQLLDALLHRLNADREDNRQQFDHANGSFFSPMSERLVTFLEQQKTIPHDIHQRLSFFFLTAIDRPLRAESGGITFEYLAIRNLWARLPSIVTKEEDAHLYLPTLDRMYTLAYDEEEKNAQHWWTSFWITLGMKFPLLAKQRIEQLLIAAIDRKDFTCLNLLTNLYNECQEAFHLRLDDLISQLFLNNDQYLYSLAYLLFLITREHPELITAKHLEQIFPSLDDLSTQGTGILFQALNSVASAQPNLFDIYQKTFLDRINEKQDVLAYICFQHYLIASAVTHEEEKARESVDILIQILGNERTPSNIQSYIFYGLQLIGVRYKHALDQHRNDLIPFQSNPTCRFLLDYIDGHKMTEENQIAISKAQEEMGLIEKRVVKTEKDLQQVSEDVKEQAINTNDIRTRVDRVDTQLTDVKEQIEKQSREIERIDQKTLSSVPEWGRQVSKLLNQRADNDWRLLGKRFGYSASELKHWAMQSDPSMALLNEWYLTHKTDEATYALLKMLQEINRSDVETIIRQAVTDAGQIIPDDLPDDIRRLPPVFLSYQWGCQTAVKTLKSHLEEAGYACWMDLGQMGGGDKLFQKIDAGIRGAKVVICCMTNAYTQSDNCSREVHLSVSTGKPIIPLQMEKQSWPPEGALGPIMSEYLFIRFFDRKNSTNPNFWPEERFTELLGQIRYHVAFDPAMISPRYHNWFVPRVDSLIFIQPNQEKQTLLKDTPLVVTHPEVMISYNWDRQSDIVALYRRLTQMGYRVWLDIFQMGGGDSLFEKIDTGIRHALCVIACITPKYTMSINCRREMALADALKKPIIPLLLEQTSTWPPPGPMSLVFADKVYIDLKDKKPPTPNDDLWVNKEFQQILNLLKQYVPQVQAENPSRSLINMQRPVSAAKDTLETNKRPQRVSSAPTIPQSQACSIM